MPLDGAAVSQALRALYTYVARQSEEKKSSTTPLFEDDGIIYLQLSLKKTPLKHTTKPIRIPLAHSLLTPSSSICLITKDPPRPRPSPSPSSSTSSTPSSARRSSRSLPPYLPPTSLVSYFAAHPIPSLTLLPLTALRREYHRFADRRLLLSLHDLFLADARVLPLLPSLLGVKFFDKKRQPAPVDLTVRDVGGEVRRAMGCTWMWVPAGSSMQVKVGRLSMSRLEVAENVMAAVDEVVRRVPGKWGNVQMVGVKTQDSITLPVYSSLPLQSIRGVKEDDVQAGGEGEEDEEAGEEEGKEGDAEEEEGGEQEMKAPAPLPLKAAQKRKRTDDAEFASAAKAPLKQQQPRGPSTAPAVNGHRAPPSAGAAPSATPSKASLKATPSKPTPAKAKMPPTSAAEDDDEDKEEEDEIRLHADLQAEPLPTPSKKQRTQTPTRASARLTTPARATPSRKVQPSPAQQRKATAAELPTAAVAGLVKGKPGAGVGRRKSLPAGAVGQKAASQSIAPGSARKTRG